MQRSLKNGYAGRFLLNDAAFERNGAQWCLGGITPTGAIGLGMYCACFFLSPRMDHNLLPSRTRQMRLARMEGALRELSNVFFAGFIYTKNFTCFNFHIF